MKISYDPLKRTQTLAEREIDFADAGHVFAGRTIDVPDERRDYGEVRMQTIGYLAGRMVMVVWTPRTSGRHIISMRKCNEREQKRYCHRLEEA